MARLFKGRPHLNDVQGRKEGREGEGEPSMFFREYTVYQLWDRGDFRLCFGFPLSLSNRFYDLNTSSFSFRFLI